MNLTEYMNSAIERLVKDALRASLRNPQESAFLLRCTASQKKAAEKRRSMDQSGTHIPPFLIASIASKCNLHCAGCYARANHSCGEQAGKELDAGRWEQIFAEASELGVSFILLAGGEPLMRKDVLEAAAEHPELIFPVFSNGTMLNGSYLELFHRNRNLLPVLSIEGDKEQTDQRRGSGTFRILSDSMKNLCSRGIFYGASVTVTKENLAEVTGEEFIGTLSQNGCKLVFFVEYVPVDGRDDLAPGDVERELLAQNQEKLRGQYPDLIFLSFPGDEKQMGGCLAAGRGFFHINPAGDAEPCPFSPYSDISVRNGSLKQALQSPLFRKIRSEALGECDHFGGCALFQKQSEVQRLLAGL
jgi:MoaA/NifB/PqqE/SkfB family radical SAM enzyme